MATYRQDLILTTLPVGQSTASVNGVTRTFLNFSVIVSMRLGSDQVSAQLSNYPDWASPGRTWPDTVAELLPGMRLHLQNLPGAPAYPVEIVGTHQPDAARFAAAFPGSTPVTPYVFEGFDKHKIRSAPVGQIVDAVQSVYGRFGFSSPTSFPPYKDLVGTTAFGPMGFQQNNPPRSIAGVDQIPGSGQKRKADLNKALESALAASKAIPYDLSTIASATGIKGAKTSMAFLQLQRFLQRNLPAVSPLTTSPPVPQWDFHQRVGGLHSLPTLLRVFGLVLDLRAGPVDPALVTAWEAAGGSDTLAYVTVPASKFLLAGTSTSVVHPKTHTHLAKNIFKATPKDPAHTDHASRMLKLGDPSLYRIIRVDHDSAGIKAIQFANNVTRSRDATGKLSTLSPENYALPALHTAGFAVARSGRATQMVAALARQTSLQDGFFGAAATPTLYEDDLIRGYRLDVLDVSDGVWRSLMWRQGTVTVEGTAALNVLEEDTVVPAPTTAKRTESTTADLYLQETLSRWDGWSLAVPRLGSPFVGAGPTSSDSGSTGFNVTTDWHVPGSSTSGNPETSAGNARRLPRLRFGRSYQLRARVTDLAGNSFSVSAAPKASDLLISPPMKHLRYEPFAAPRSVLLATDKWTADSLRPGDSEEVVVIRSESATVNATSSLDNATSVRLLLPPQTSVNLAEQHGAFDDAIAGKPMDQALAVYTDIANRDGTPIHADATLLNPAEPVSTENPYLFPNSQPINYLPEVPVQAALVRHLPMNAFKLTTATLPFDTAHAGWPTLQAVRVRLSRGATTWTTTPVTIADNVTTELDLTLAKGVMVTTLVNCGINLSTVSIMALWEWIQAYAKAHNQSPTTVLNHIVAGEHWMFTPWRKVTFIHAVRTPLKNPVLEFKPTKTVIGQTYALIKGTKDDPTDGTILFSRRSTARVDVQATWSMPVDTGSNSDPVTPQAFSAHALSIEPTRGGRGWVADANGSIQILDAQNLSKKHEFHDTKFRAVTYKGTATSFYVEYFREQFNLAFAGDPIAALKADPVKPNVAFEASTVRLTLHWTDNGQPRTRILAQAPPGTHHDVGAPTPGDYVVVEDPTLNGPNPVSATNGTIQLLANANVSSAGMTNLTVEFSYVGPTIHTFSDPVADKTKNMHILNSARPKAPKPLYVVPIYKRTASSTSVMRTGGGLRVYLDRPWWSSGDEETLGVVCWHRNLTSAKLPPKALAPYVTQWGFDPIFKSSTFLPDQPTPTCFPLATRMSTSGSLTIEESTTKVDVAGHKVGYDTSRKLWYCDIRVTDPKGKSLTTYTPFIRFALARYQPFSIANAHLSRVVLVDYAQLAPDRHLTIAGSDVKRAATITGRSARATSSSTQANRMVLIIEERDNRVPDDALAWRPAHGPTGFTNRFTMAAAAASSTSDFVSWSAEVQLPAGNTRPLRLTFEEYERITGSTGHGRLVWTESIVVQAGLPT